MIRTMTLVVVLVCSALIGGCSTTVLTAPCDSPKVSNSSVPSAYLVMLPYAYREPGETPRTRNDAVQALNDLAGLQVVRMGADSSDMHVTLLKDRGNGCDIEAVYRKFTEKSFFSNELLSTVVFYWGHVYEDKGRLLVQSHVRTLWKNPNENLIEVKATTSDGAATLPFTGRIPSNTVSFPARSLSVDKQGEGRRSLRMSLQARDEPSLRGKAVQLPEKFVIHRLEGDWVELRDAWSARSAWVAIRDPGSHAKTVLPELSFAQALSEYASYERATSSQTAERAIQWLDEFRAAATDEVRDDGLHNATAIANVIEAVLRADRRRSSDRRRAGELMDEAVLAMPTNSAVLNLAAVLKVDQCCATKEAASEVQRRFELARRLDAGNEMIATNLLNWYRLLESKDRLLWPEPPEEIRRRAAALAAALQ